MSMTKRGRDRDRGGDKSAAAEKSARLYSAPNTEFTVSMDVKKRRCSSEKASSMDDGALHCIFQFLISSLRFQ